VEARIIYAEMDTWIVELFISDEESRFSSFIDQLHDCSFSDLLNYLKENPPQGDLAVVMRESLLKQCSVETLQSILEYVLPTTRITVETKS